MNSTSVVVVDDNEIYLSYTARKTGRALKHCTWKFAPSRTSELREKKCVADRAYTAATVHAFNFVLQDVALWQKETHVIADNLIY